MLPAVVNFAHAVSDHQHYETCATSDTHVHASSLDCDLGDMQMVKVGVYAFAKTESLLPQQFFRATLYLPTKGYIEIPTSTTNRGPPILLIIEENSIINKIIYYEI